MSDDSTFERILGSLNDAMLDDAHWPAASALIDESCGLKGNTLMVGEGPTDDKRVLYVGLYSRGQRRNDLEREYLETYHRHDECVPRVRQLAEGCLVHITDLYTVEELKSSPAYNEMFPRANQQDSLVARLDGSGGSHVLWAPGDPVARHGWGTSQVSLIEKLLPHIRQFVRVRQALVRARARATTATALLDNPRIGVVHLDRRGRIMEVNDRAGSILRQRDGLLDEGGMLRACAPHDELSFERLLADALPTSGTVAVSGSLPLHRSSGWRWSSEPSRRPSRCRAKPRSSTRSRRSARM